MEPTPCVGKDADPADFLEGVFENAPLPIQVYGADGGSLRYNRRFRELFGLKNPVDCDADHDGDPLAELVRRCAARGTREPFAVAPRWYRRAASTGEGGGGRICASLTLLPLADPIGRIVRVAVFFQDVTEKLEREEALARLARESKRNAAILDAALDCVITMDATGKVTYFNAAAEQTFGYSRAYAVGRTVAELVVPPRYREAHRAGLERYLTTREGSMMRHRIELTAMRAGGAEFPVEVIIVPCETAGPPVFAGVIRDLTKPKEVEKALRRSEARFRRLSEAGILGVSTGSIDGGILEANDALARMLGYTPEEIGTGAVRWDEITPPEWRYTDERAIEQLRETGVAAPWEKEYLRTDGTRIPVLLGVAMLDAGKGECAAFILDLSDQKEAERAVERMREEREAGLKESIRARDDFLAVAGHELKTPLAALLLQLQSLQRNASAELSPRIGVRLDKAVGAGHRLRRLVDQLLDVSRLTSGGLRLEPEPVDLAELVDEIVARTRETRSGFVGPLLVGGERHVLGRWDRERIEQAIENVIENAVKYGEGKPVEIDLWREGGDVVVCVTDHGVGIDEEHQKRIFERFERAVSARDFGGLGLGLWIARRVVEASGGSITVRSAPGQGAAFTVRLPTNTRATDGTEGADARA
jgi:PAS domain S-box-containing protein